MTLNMRAGWCVVALMLASLASGTALAQSSGSAGDSLAQAAQQLADGDVVHAQHTLESLLAHADRLSNQQRMEASAMLGLAIRRAERLGQADPLALSLQKAQVALLSADIRSAERHARAVAASSSASASNISDAARLLGQIESRRSELAKLVPGWFEQAERDFQAQRYADAAAGFDAVYRSGVALEESKLSMLNRYRLELSAMDVETGGASLGVMQPGVVRDRADDQPGDNDVVEIDDRPQAQPTTEPEAEEPAEELVQDAQPAEEQAQPVEQVQPATPIDDSDVIQVAMRAQALSLLSEAKRAQEARQLSTAADKYRQVLDEYAEFLRADELEEARNGLARTQIDLRGQTGGNALETYQESQRLARQQITALFDNYMEQAREALASGDTQTARDAVGKADLEISRATNLFAESTLQDFRRQIDELRVEVTDVEEQIRIAQQRAEEIATREAAEQSAKQQATERNRKINELIDRARKFQAELRYDLALQAVEELLVVDPNNPAGLLMKDLYEAILIYRRFENLRDRREKAMAQLGVDSQEAAIPTPNIIDYPRDWPSKTLQRGGGLRFSESPQNRRIMSLLDSRRVAATTPLVDVALEDALAYVEELGEGKLNLDVDWQSLEMIDVRRDTPVSLNVQGVTVKTLLDRLLEKVSPDPYEQADWAVIDGILTVASEEKLRRNTVSYPYDVSDLLMDTPSYDSVPDIELASVLRSDAGSIARSPVESEDFRSRVTRLTMEEKRDRIVELIESHVDPHSWRSHGGETGSIFPIGRNLVITTTARNHQEISGLLQMLRETRAMQINVETRFLLVNQDWFEEIGFDLDVVFNANNNQVRAAQAVDPTIQARDFFNFNGSSPTFGQVGPGLNRNVSGQAPTVGTMGTPNPQTIGVVNPRPNSPIGLLQNSFGLSRGLAPETGIAGDILGASPALGVAFQFLDDVQVDFVMTATQADRRSVQLTAPRLTFTNGQTANVFVATQVSFVSDLQPIVGESAVGFDPTVDVVSEGVTLLVEGTISADRRYVTMNVDAGVSRIDSFGQEEVTAVAGGQLVNSATTGSFIQLPQVTVTRVQTTVTVPDQGTILLGGQRVITEFDVETGVPVLSKIPILNRFFSNRIESKEEQTLLILMKPTVLIQSEQEESNFPGLLDSVRAGLGG